MLTKFTFIPPLVEKLAKVKGVTVNEAYDTLTVKDKKTIDLANYALVLASDYLNISSFRTNPIQFNPVELWATALDVRPEDLDAVLENTDSNVRLEHVVYFIQRMVFSKSGYRDAEGTIKLSKEPKDVLHVVKDLIDYTVREHGEAMVYATNLFETYHKLMTSQPSFKNGELSKHDVVEEQQRIL